jgi:predicted PurR-regulated permease PerM
MAQPFEHTDAPLATPSEAALEAERRAGARWQQLGQRLRSVTPAGLARFVLAAGALSIVIWQLWQARVVLAPFFAGMVLAYVTAPLVNRLDRLLPRPIAVLVLVIGELLLLIGLVATLVPALFGQLGRLLTGLPSSADLRQLVDQLSAYLRTLPAPTQEFISGGVQQLAGDMRTNFTSYVQGLLRLAVTGAFSLLSTFGFLLGFLIVPTWLMALLTDQRAGVEALDRHLPGWMRKDFWAVVRIVDRPLRAYVNGQLVMALAMGGLTYLGLALLQRWGWLVVEYKLLFALTAAALELIPLVGPTLYAVLAGLLGLTVSPQAAGLLIGLAVLSQLLANQLVAPQIERRYAAHIPTVLLAVAVVLISQFGLFWLLLAGPLTAIVVDLYRYVYGRFREPPRPAGLLPGEPLPTVAPAVTAPASRRMGQAHRRGRVRTPEAPRAGGA